jgi:hypothetical protein
MNQFLANLAPPESESEEQYPFRYGWRHVPTTRPDGSRTFEEVPLTWEGLLFPEEDDRGVEKPPHTRDRSYLHYSLCRHFDQRIDALVLADCRVDCAVPGMRPIRPDVTVLFGVKKWLQQGTFRVAEEGGRPVLAVEITSPNTHTHDPYNKPPLYCNRIRSVGWTCRLWGCYSGRWTIAPGCTVP